MHLWAKVISAASAELLSITEHDLLIGSPLFVVQYRLFCLLNSRSYKPWIPPIRTLNQAASFPLYTLPIDPVRVLALPQEHIPRQRLPVRRMHVHKTLLYIFYRSGRCRIPTLVMELLEDFIDFSLVRADIIRPPGPL